MFMFPISRSCSRPSFQPASQRAPKGSGTNGGLVLVLVAWSRLEWYWIGRDLCSGRYNVPG